MASSGWQTEQFLYKYSDKVSLYGNLYISSITRSGTDVTVTGKIMVKAKGTNGYYTTYNYGVKAGVSGQSYAKIVANGAQIKVGGTQYEANISATISGVSPSATTASLTLGWKACTNSGCSSSYWNVQKTFALQLDPGGTAPTGLGALYLTAHNGATLFMSISDYGTPLGDDRYIEGAILEKTATNFSGPRMVNRLYGVTTGTVFISNASIPLSGGLNIKSNSEYKYGVYASNGSLSSFNVIGTLVTRPEPVSDAQVVSKTDTTSTISFTRPGEGGGVYEIVVEYSTDGTTWTEASGSSFTVNTTTGVVLIRTRTTAGSSEAVIVMLSYNKLYAGVIGRAREIKKLYGSVGGNSKEIKKLYASVDGEAKLIYAR